ncbi:MAG: sigma-54-dependent Fis family transcriptional regulator, partial [Proteobacteria bacterium]|nr:sigma-54-dependent Fis family transcriptional regulator [Pseudomonadota bacterium]
YDWPGNVRELQNAVQQYLTLQKMEFIEIRPDDRTLVKELNTVSGTLSSESTLTGRMQQIEKEIIRQCLEKNKWHKTNTAEELGIDRRSLFRKIRILEL